MHLKASLVLQNLFILNMLMVHVTAFVPWCMNMPLSDQIPILKARPVRHYVLGEHWPTVHWEEPYTRRDALANKRISGRVQRLETLVHDLCCALVFCDDIALQEREMLASGAIWMDLSSEMKRRPLLLRRTVADIAWRHGTPVSAPEHKWQVAKEDKK